MSLYGQASLTFCDIVKPLKDIGLSTKNITTGNCKIVLKILLQPDVLFN